MYYQIPSDLPLHEKLTAFMQRVNDAQRVIKCFLEKLGRPTSAIAKHGYIVGVSGLSFDHQLNDWKKTRSVHGRHYYWPKALRTNHGLLRQLSELPTITEQEFNDLVDFKPEMVLNDETGHAVFRHRPGLIMLTGSALLNIPDSWNDYLPPAGVVAITKERAAELVSAEQEDNKDAPTPAN